jgi:hypothetical protein
MALPKQVKPTLPLVPKKTLSARREQLLEFINKDGTYLPKSVLHADLDRGMLDFVKDDLQVVTAGKNIPKLLYLQILTSIPNLHSLLWLDNLRLSLEQILRYNIQFQTENNFIMHLSQLGMVMNKVWTYIQFHNQFL